MRDIERRLGEAVPALHTSTCLPACLLACAYDSIAVEIFAGRVECGLMKRGQIGSASLDLFVSVWRRVC